MKKVWPNTKSGIGSSSRLNTIMPSINHENSQLFPHPSSTALMSNGSQYNTSFMTSPSCDSLVEVSSETGRFCFVLIVYANLTVDGPEDVYRTARSLYRCWLSCKDAFPSFRTQDKWVVDAWNEAYSRTGTHPNSLRQEEEACLVFVTYGTASLRFSVQM